MKLSGVKVIDLSAFLPGPHLTMMMADHGAEVIKVEPRTGEPTRQIGLKQGAHSIYFANTNRGKKSISVDLKNPEGREALLRLIETADVVIETYRPGVASRLGVDYEAVKARAPRLVYCSISAFGQDSPWRDRPAHDLSVIATAGVGDLTRGQDGKPTIPGSPPSDMASSLMALSGILMALLRARETGKGDYLDIAMHDCVLSWTPYIVGPTFAEDRAPVPAEERLFGGAALYGVYETSDGRWVTLGGSEAKFARNLLSALGREDLIEAATGQPGAGQLPVKQFLQQTFLSKSMAEWVDWFADKDVCFAPVLDFKESLESEQVAARRMVLQDGEGHRHLGIPIKFAEEPGQVDFRLPAIGEDNLEVFTAAGLEAEEVARLQETGALYSDRQAGD